MTYDDDDDDDNQNKFDIATYIGLIVKIDISIINIFLNTTIYSNFYEFYIIGLKMTKLGRNMLP